MFVYDISALGAARPLLGWYQESRAGLFLKHASRQPSFSPGLLQARLSHTCHKRDKLRPRPGNCAWTRDDKRKAKARRSALDPHKVSQTLKKKTPSSQAVQVICTLARYAKPQTPPNPKPAIFAEFWRRYLDGKWSLSSRSGPFCGRRAVWFAPSCTGRNLPVNVTRVRRRGYTVWKTPFGALSKGDGFANDDTDDHRTYTHQKAHHKCKEQDGVGLEWLRIKRRGCHHFYARL